MSRNGVVEIYWYLTSGIPLDSFIRTAAKGSSLLGICSDIFQRIRVQHAQLVSFVNLTMLPILQIFIFTCCSQLVLLDLQLSEKKNIMSLLSVYQNEYAGILKETTFFIIKCSLFSSRIFEMFTLLITFCASKREKESEEGCRLLL
jgi:hypothetical protein